MAFIIGITGGIGSGKTQVTNLLQQNNVPIFDTDVVARQLVEPGTKALAAIAEHFGDDILTETGSLNRNKLRHIIFADLTAKQWLESLLHPLVFTQLQQPLQAITGDYGVLVSPLLLEGKQKTLVDLIVVVDATEQQQIARATHRDKAQASDIEAIIQAQLSRQQRLLKADYIIDNTKDLQYLKEQVEQLMQLVDERISEST